MKQMGNFTQRITIKDPDGEEKENEKSNILRYEQFSPALIIT